MQRCLLPVCCLCLVLSTARGAAPELIRSARSGPWSAPATWDKGKVPGAGDRVQVRAGHTVTYDVVCDKVIRFIHVAGTLTFAHDRDTRLDVGLIKVQPGDDAREDGFNCDDHVAEPEPGKPRATFAVGTPDQPIDARRTALIRLTYIDGMDKESCPAIVCCAGRMDIHGAVLSRSWVKLGATAKKGDTEVSLAEAVKGWRVGDRVILTATTRQQKVGPKTFRTSTRDLTYTEERTVKAIDGSKLTLEKALDLDHRGDGDYRGEVANLSRNVVIESADPKGVRGHTMYHRHSAVAISYAEFHHLGKEGVLGRYSIHFHLVRDTMRGSYVEGASIWDSDNRWVTIHGTDYLVVRDCIGYQSQGHGFFLEDGTEVFNVLDRNLAVQAYTTKPLPKQVLPYDKNDGSGVWWANCLNSFTHNVAVECDEYGYFFQAPKTNEFDPVLAVPQADGTRRKVDIRTLPFVRFEGNEAHAQRRHAFNLGGGVPFGEPNVGGVGPDTKHPFVIRDMKLWDVHWAFHPISPCVQVENMDIADADYGVWRPTYVKHAYRGVKVDRVKVPEFSPTGTKPREADYPKPLDAVDDLPPATVILRVIREGGNRLRVRGVTSDNGTVKKVTVNGKEAKATAANFAE